MSFISDITINISAFRITIGNKINALKTLIDGKANIAGNNIPPLTHWTNLHAGGLDDYVFHGSDVGSNFESVLVIDQGAIFRTNKGGMQSWLGLSDYVTRNTQETVNAKKQWTTAQTDVALPNYFKHIRNIAAMSFAGNVTADNYFLINLGSTLAGIMWEAEIEIYTYNQTVGINLAQTRVKRFLITGYHNTTAGISFNRSVSLISGQDSEIESVTYFRDANGFIVLAVKPSITWGHPKVYLKRLSLYYNAPDTTENGIIANASVSYTNDVSNLTLYYVVANTNINKNIDSQNISNYTTDTNNYLDIITTTNGTTAGTVYTFKRVGLSDLSITLTPASDLFSGVVTTGAQTWEGVKSFLKSPVVPNAQNANEAVNKGQVDSAGYIRALTTGGNIIPYDPTNDADNFLTGVFYAAGSNKPAGINSNVLSLSANVAYVFQLGSPFNSESTFVRSKIGTSWTPWRELYHSGNFNPANYALLSQVYTQAQTLGLFVGKTGVETIQDTKTFTHSPVVPNATLSGHTVNLGQLSSLLANYALSSAIPTNNNQLANGAGYITASALGGYVLQTSLTTQLANYVTANGVQNITATKTFTVSPVVPNGTLAGHTVNLGQMQTYVAGLGYQTAAQVTNIVNNAVAGIPTPGNGTVVLQGIGSLAGTATFSMNQTNNVVGSFDLTAQTKSDIQRGVNASEIIPSIVEGVDLHYVNSTVPVAFSIGKKRTIINVANGLTDAEIHVEDGLYDGYELAINGCGEWSATLTGNVQSACRIKDTLAIGGKNILFWWIADLNRWVEAV